MILCREGETLESRHSLIIEALRTGDIEAARKAILAEVNETRETILGRIIEEEGAFWQLDN